MILTIEAIGTLQSVCTEALDMDEFGTQQITLHISHVDRGENGRLRLTGSA